MAANTSSGVLVYRDDGGEILFGHGFSSLAYKWVELECVYGAGRGSCSPGPQLHLCVDEH